MRSATRRTVIIAVSLFAAATADLSGPPVMVDDVVVGTVVDWLAARLK